MSSKVFYNHLNEITGHAQKDNHFWCFKALLQTNERGKKCSDQMPFITLANYLLDWRRIG